MINRFALSTITKYHIFSNHNQRRSLSKVIKTAMGCLVYQTNKRLSQAKADKIAFAITYNFNYSPKYLSLDQQRKIQLYSQSINQLLNTKQFAELVIFIQQLTVFYIEQLNNKPIKQRKQIKNIILSSIRQVLINPNQQIDQQKLLKIMDYLYDNIDTGIGSQIQIIKEKIDILNTMQRLQRKSDENMVQRIINIIQSCLQYELYSEAQQLQNQIDIYKSNKQNLSCQQSLFIKNSINKAILFTYQNQLQSAIRQYQTIIEHNPSTLSIISTIHYNLAEIYQLQQKYKLAIQSYQIVQKANDEVKVDILFKLAYNYDKLHDFDASIKKYKQIEKVLEDEENTSQEEIVELKRQLFSKLGLLYNKILDHKHSIGYFEQYFKLMKGRQIIEHEIHENCFLKMIQSYEQTNQLNLALQTYKQLSRYYRIQGNDTGRQNTIDKIKALQNQTIIE